MRWVSECTSAWLLGPLLPAASWALSSCVADVFLGNAGRGPSPAPPASARAATVSVSSWCSARSRRAWCSRCRACARIAEGRVSHEAKVAGTARGWSRSRYHYPYPSSHHADLPSSFRTAGTVISDKDRCPQCRGNRVVQEKKILEVHVDKGMQHNQKIVFQGEADEAVRNRSPAHPPQRTVERYCSRA